ncbi:MAG: hypothetical protein PUI85_05170 [Eubacteriales bacterium]|nr:hypothetical protein [Eubacteriales bacterium]MDY3332492.1 hypothetical protein [Gallibacter sp.]
MDTSKQKFSITNKNFTTLKNKLIFCKENLLSEIERAKAKIKGMIVDEMFKCSKHTVCNSLDDAVFHEYMHAKTTKKVMYAKYEQLCEADGYAEISEVAESDLAETIAEIGVLKKQGKYELVSDRGKKIFEEIIGD